MKKKPYWVTLAIVAMISISLAFTKEESPRYKNLKILPKNISEKQMDSVMEHYEKALGVHCDFCHVKIANADSLDFASDGNKHKLRARDMMKMTDKINDKYFDLTGGKRDLNTELMVTCYTCHHGKTEPEVKAKQQL